MCRKIDYIRKGQLLEKGLPSLVAQKSYFQFRLSQYGDAKVTLYHKSAKNKFLAITYDTLNEISCLNDKLKNISDSDILECQRINNAKYHKNKRLSVAINKMINFSQIAQKNLLFLTLTFNDSGLALKDNVRRKYVAQFLKDNTLLYVANIDYGEEYGREHYHAVCVGTINPHNWTYGTVNIKHVKITKYCDTKLAKYVAKLTNHALKECALTKSNKRQVLLYQKSFDKEYVRLLSLYGLQPLQEDCSKIFETTAESTEN